MKTTTGDYEYDYTTAYSEDESEISYERIIAYCAIGLLSSVGIGAGVYFAAVDWAVSSPMLLSLESMISYQ